MAAAGLVGTPATWTWTEIGAESTPAATVWGGDTKASVVGDQARNDRHVFGIAAPERSPAHQVPCGGALHAPIPGSAGVSSPESRIAAAIRASSAPVCSAKSPGSRASEFLGAQAKPKRSIARPATAPWLRSA